VDAFQGQERDIMIVSCVRANSEGKIGFVYCEKRMNVSITRAKYALFVFGNRQTLLDYYKTTNYWEMYINDHQKKQTLISVASKDLASAKQAIRDILLPADK
jgi:superfamily I DNA and/or RNA helicase